MCSICYIKNRSCNCYFAYPSNPPKVVKNYFHTRKLHLSTFSRNLTEQHSQAPFVLHLWVSRWGNMNSYPVFAVLKPIDESTPNQNLKPNTIGELQNKTPQLHHSSPTSLSSFYQTRFYWNASLKQISYSKLKA